MLVMLRRRQLLVASLSCSSLLLLLVYSNSRVPTQHEVRSVGALRQLNSERSLSGERATWLPNNQSLAHESSSSVLHQSQTFRNGSINYNVVVVEPQNYDGQLQASAFSSNTEISVCPNNSCSAAESGPGPGKSLVNDTFVPSQDQTVDTAAAMQVNDEPPSQTIPEEAALKYVKKPLISNPKKFRYVPKMDAKTWSGAYPQLVKAGVSAASYRVNFEYRNFPGELDFTPGGVVGRDRVKRILILTTWRSGSTFLGDIFNAYPGTFYSFEPLHQLLQKQHLEDGPLKQPVLELLRNIMTCNMTDQHDYFDYVRNNTFLFTHNSRYWQSCSINRALCYDPHFFNKVCEVFPVNVIKTVRLGAAPLGELLQDPSLDLRVIHLVRDPRGTMHSRHRLDWCRAPVCSDPSIVCDHLLLDLHHSQTLQAKYPDRFLLVRYEDLGTQPEAMASLILDFVGLPSTNSVKNFIAEHTTLESKRRSDAAAAKSSDGGGDGTPRRGRRRKPTNAYSTFRNSRTTTFAWRNALNYSAVAAIQDVCEAPMRLLNLRIFKNEIEYKNENLTILLPEK
ncbi:carbohydrate sulfotransferase 5 [Hyalella azteca]|uniref:Carbohydrate sulfotransferase 5 n=1 Tax=Hyalella azteca TaxID=294128 RepID=A0A8B7NW98_HYAAZ|nr:carbohydrate sulfotransferase 5 [Hyalella azteca]